MSDRCAALCRVLCVWADVTKLQRIIQSRWENVPVRLVPTERMNYAFEIKLDNEVVYDKVFGDGFVNSEQTERILYLIRLKLKQHWPNGAF
jgi:hypothetical protein